MLQNTVSRIHVCKKAGIEEYKTFVLQATTAMQLHVPYLLDQTLRLLFISALNFVRLLHVYSRAVAIREQHLFNSVKTLCKYTCTKSTGVSTDGMEDDEIHCLKEGGVANDARESGIRHTANPTFLLLATPPEVDDVDPFADIEEELAKNEVVLKDC